MIAYINHKGRLVEVECTAHARRRFIQRWSLLNPHEPLPKEDDALEEFIGELFSKTQKEAINDRFLKTRLDKHGSDTIYFQGRGFRFVIQNKALVTVEITGKKLKILNHVDFDSHWQKRCYAREA